MGTETERKFLTCSDSWRSETTGSARMRQAYFKDTHSTTVRVRIVENAAFLTVKGRAKGISRSEFEYEIPVSDAEAMMREFCGRGVVEKVRHNVVFSGMRWEIDEFSGENAGLVTAEIELDAPDEAFVRPPWLGREVTCEAEYCNSSLALKPYGGWAAKP